MIMYHYQYDHVTKWTRATTLHVSTDQVTDPRYIIGI